MRSIPVLLLMFAVGCGGASERPPTHPVSGTITMDSKPVVDANVVFQPVKPDAGTPAFGKTNSDGYYELTTFDTGDGAMAAQYTITVSKQNAQDAMDEEIDLDDPGDAYDMMGGTGEAKPSDELPAKYASPATSPEKRTVAEGSNEFSFELVP